MAPWHLGALHPIEQALTLLLAFGPFVALVVVVVVRRKQDAREAEEPRDGSPETGTGIRTVSGADGHSPPSPHRSRRRD